MRVRLGNRIYFCTVATHRPTSDLILLTTSNGIYTVKMSSNLEASDCYEILLMRGYYDFTLCDYSN